MKTLVAVVMLASSCSWALMEREPSDFNVERGEPHCTGNNGFAGWDFLNGIGAIAGGFAFPSSSDPNSNAAATAKVGGVIIGLAYFASAITGLNWSSTCGDLRTKRDKLTNEDHERWQHVRVHSSSPAAPAIDAGVSDANATEDAGE